jgi:hypothetical protein
MPRGGEKDKDDMGYAGETIRLGGKVRHIKYTIPGLKMLARPFGTVVDGLGAFEGFNQKFDEEGIDKLAKLLHAGLVHEDRELAFEVVEGMININNFQLLPMKLITALRGSQPSNKGGSGEGNPT